MRAILIDNDSHALYMLEKHLLNLSEIEIVGSYDDPYIGKEALISESSNILFLEACLPRLSGIVLEKQLRPRLALVFITDYFKRGHLFLTK